MGATVGGAIGAGEGARDRTAFWGGLLVAFGSLGVVATSICYGMSPPDAAMPQATIDLSAAADGAVKGAVTMRLAGLFGVTGDVAITAGGFLLAMRGAGIEAGGWFLIGLSTIIFAMVDAMVGFVLTPVAIAAGATTSFLAMKILFDTLFLLGTATFGAGAALATVASALGGRGSIVRALAILGFATGLAALVTGGGSLGGVHLEPYLGAGILGGSAVFTFIGLQIALAPRTPRWVRADLSRRPASRGALDRRRCRRAS